MTSKGETSSSNVTSDVHSDSTSYVATSVSHPKLLTISPAAIRAFLKNYDAYCRTVIARAKQLQVDGTSSRTTEAVSPVDIKYCVDAQYLTSAIALGLIDGVSSYDELDNITLRRYLDEKSKESKEAISLDSLDEIVERELFMDMKNRHARSRIESLFIDYHALLTKH